LLLGCGTLWAACDNLLEYHPYEGKIDGETGILAKNVARIEAACQGRRTIRFAFITDTQRYYDDTHDVVNLLNARTDLDFVVHGGDLTDFGATDEFEWMRDELNRLRVPYVTVIGNHDCIGHGEDIYETVFGPENYGFTAGSVRFECLNTVALEYDYSNPVPDFTFMKTERERVDSLNRLTPDSITHTVFVMHAAPGDEQFNNNVSEAFNYYTAQYPGLTDDAPQYTASLLRPSPVSADTLLGSKLLSFCVYGHTHNYNIKLPFSNGILYYNCASIHKREYFLFTIDDSGYDFERIFF
jgi:predicted phosphodiesterase